MPHIAATARSSIRRAGVLLAAAAVAATSLAAAIGVSPATMVTTPVIELTRIAPATTFAQPVLVTNAGDSRLFVVERAGRVRIIANGTTLATPFLDITSKVRSDYAEEGLLGLAFHPGYPVDRRFFVAYTKPDLSLQVSAFEVSGNANVASPTETPILDIPHPTNQNHNGGMLAFGADGDLYLGTGDGGAGGDPSNNAQDLGVLLGKLLRIDVDHPSGGRAYGIPAGNPFVGVSGARPEIWAYGLRNPWRWSFDRATHDLWIGDVGQSAYEEIDRATAAAGLGKGANYGWSCREGFHVYSASRCPSGGLIDPLAEYAHGTGDSVGCAVTGGYVYRGSLYPALQGRYLFGDYCSGRIWSLSATGSAPQTPEQLTQTSLHISSFGEDASGELYVVDLGGGIYHITSPVSRLAGRDRYATSAAVAGQYPAGLAVAYVASGEDFPDALAGAPVAAMHDAPLLIVRRDVIPAAIVSSLRALRPASIIVLGGPPAVGEGVAAALGPYTSPAGRVSRLAGHDRYATAVAISKASIAPPAPVVFIATGENYPDALSAAPLAAARGGPLLLVPTRAGVGCSTTGAPVPCIVETELHRLAPQAIVIVGGTNVVSATIGTWLEATFAPAGGTTRLAGHDRYGTSAAIVTQFAARPKTAYVATGQAFPDALSGAPLAGAEGQPVLLVRPDAIPGSIAAALRALQPRSIVVLGGPPAVSDATAIALGDYVVP